eukprot:1145834-Pelagomonas_calceolata.AAC.1
MPTRLQTHEVRTGGCGDICCGACEATEGFLTYSKACPAKFWGSDGQGVAPSGQSQLGASPNYYHPSQPAWAHDM